MNVSTFIEKHIEYLKGHKGKLVNLKELPQEYLTTTPASGGWSIAECILHMLLATRPYLDRIEKEIATSSVENTPNFKRGILGRYFTYGMLPQKNGTIKNKMKTMSWFDPGKSKKYDEYSNLTGQELINELQLVYNRLHSALEQSQNLNLNKHKIVSTLGPIIQFKLGDAFAFTLAHNARHFHQISRIQKNITAID